MSMYVHVHVEGLNYDYCISGNFRLSNLHKTNFCLCIFRKDGTRSMVTPIINNFSV